MMTVGELIEELKKYPAHQRAVISDGESAHFVIDTHQGRSSDEAVVVIDGKGRA